MGSNEYAHPKQAKPLMKLISRMFKPQTLRVQKMSFKKKHKVKFY